MQMLVSSWVGKIQIYWQAASECHSFCPVDIWSHVRNQFLFTSNWAIHTFRVDFDSERSFTSCSSSGITSIVRQPFKDSQRVQKHLRNEWNIVGNCNIEREVSHRKVSHEFHIKTVAHTQILGMQWICVCDTWICVCSLGCVAFEFVCAPAP